MEGKLEEIQIENISKTQITEKINSMEGKLEEIQIENISKTQITESR
jgi:hypothetical protein